MVVGKDEAGCPQVERAAYNLPRKQVYLGDTSFRDTLLGEYAVLSVKEKGVNLFGTFVGKGDEEIVQRRFGVWQDWTFEHLALQHVSYQWLDGRKQFNQNRFARNSSGQGRLA